MSDVLKKYPVRYMGPSWETDDEGEFILPERSLGYGVALWCMTWLNDINGETDEKGKVKSFSFTQEQLRLVLWWYAVDKKNRFIYRQGVIQRLKGAGKDPLAAVLCLAEWLGPVEYSHDDENGNPVGKRNQTAWVQLAAVKQEQCRNTAIFFATLISDRLKEAAKVDMGIELYRAYGGRVRMELLTTSARSSEGNRPTFFLINEAQWWTSKLNGPKELFEVVKGNLEKRDYRYLCIANAFIPGEDSLLEDLRYTADMIIEHPELQETERLMYDSIEANDKTPLDPDTLREVLPAVYGDAVWLHKATDSIVGSLCSPKANIRDLRRKWLNQIVADEDGLVHVGQWEALEAKNAVLRRDDTIVLGFDGGKTDDATALIAIRTVDMCVFPLGIWENPGGSAGVDWRVDQYEVDSAVHQAFRMYNVVGFFADVALWESYIDSWTTQYQERLKVKATNNEAVRFDMRGNLRALTMIHEQMLSHIWDGKLKHDGDPTLRRHVLNARRRDNNFGVSFGKESRSSKKKVDGYAAMMLAHAAALRYRKLGETDKPRSNSMHTMRGW